MVPLMSARLLLSPTNCSLLLTGGGLLAGLEHLVAFNSDVSQRVSKKIYELARGPDGAYVWSVLSTELGIGRFDHSSFLISTKRVTQFMDHYLSLGPYVHPSII